MYLLCGYLKILQKYFYVLFGAQKVPKLCLEEKKNQTQKYDYQTEHLKKCRKWSFMCTCFFQMVHLFSLKKISTSQNHRRVWKQLRKIRRPWKWLPLLCVTRVNEKFSELVCSCRLGCYSLIWFQSDHDRCAPLLPHTSPPQEQMTEIVSLCPTSPYGKFEWIWTHSIALASKPIA